MPLVKCIILTRHLDWKPVENFLDFQINGSTLESIEPLKNIIFNYDTKAMNESSYSVIVFKFVLLSRFKRTSNDENTYYILSSHSQRKKLKKSEFT